jgi:hypothetical protein
MFYNKGYYIRYLPRELTAKLAKYIVYPYPVILLYTDSIGYRNSMPYG